ncbi:putative reverse transcriptase domain-containing protein [Tanacetum coccineum]
MQEVILFYNGLDVPTRQILDSRGAIPTKTAADAKTANQEMAEYSQKWHNKTSRGRSTKTSDGLAAIQAQLNNLGREIKKVNEKVYAAQVGCEQCKGPHYTKDYPWKEEGKTLEEAYYTQFGRAFQGGGYRTTAPGCCHKEPRSIDQNFRNLNRANEQGAIVSVMLLSTYLNLGLGELVHTRLTMELVDRTVKYPKGIAENVLVGIGKFTFPVDFIILDMLEDIRVPLILGRPFLSLDPFLEDYIKLNDLNEPFELRRNQGNDLMPTIEEGKFKGMITLYKGDDEVTYQMVRSNPRFKHHTNEQCNKIPPLLKVNEKDVMNGVSHAYQKFKGFYKGVLNLGPDYIRNAKTEE